MMTVHAGYETPVSPGTGYYFPNAWSKIDMYMITCGAVTEQHRIPRLNHSIILGASFPRRGDRAFLFPGMYSRRGKLGRSDVEVGFSDSPAQCGLGEVSSTFATFPVRGLVMPTLSCLHIVSPQYQSPRNALIQDPGRTLAKLHGNPITNAAEESQEVSCWLPGMQTAPREGVFPQLPRCESHDDFSSLMMTSHFHSHSFL
jgi:hypothetical protein